VVATGGQSSRGRCHYGGIRPAEYVTHRGPARNSSAGSGRSRVPGSVGGEHDGTQEGEVQLREEEARAEEEAGYPPVRWRKEVRRSEVGGRPEIGAGLEAGRAKGNRDEQGEAIGPEEGRRQEAGPEEVGPEEGGRVERAGRQAPEDCTQDGEGAGQGDFAQGTGRQGRGPGRQGPGRGCAGQDVGGPKQDHESRNETNRAQEGACKEDCRQENVEEGRLEGCLP
jgi:hypothetical protein